MDKWLTCKTFCFWEIVDSPTQIQEVESSLRLDFPGTRLRIQPFCRSIAERNNNTQKAMLGASEASQKAGKTEKTWFLTCLLHRDLPGAPS